jgi:hypothetical protein
LLHAGLRPASTVADRLAEGERFAGNQIQTSGLARMGTGDGQPPTDLGQQAVHPRQPLFVGGELRKCRPPVLRLQPIRLFERGDFKHPLQQGNRQHFGITELRVGVRRVPPVGQARRGFQEFVHKTIAFDYLMLHARTPRPSFYGTQNQRSRFDSTLPRRINDLALSTQDWG